MCVVCGKPGADGTFEAVAADQHSANVTLGAQLRKDFAGATESLSTPHTDTTIAGLKRLSTIGCRRSIIDYRLSTIDIDYSLVAIVYRLSAIDDRP